LEGKSRFERLEEVIALDRRFASTTVSYLMVLAIFFNLKLIVSPIIGVGASIIFFLVNATFLGRAFFEDEPLFLKFMLGSLLLVVLLSLVGWLVMIAYNLDVLRSAIALGIVATSCSFLAKMQKKKKLGMK